MAFILDAVAKLNLWAYGAHTHLEASFAPLRTPLLNPTHETHSISRAIQFACTKPATEPILFPALLTLPLPLRGAAVRIEAGLTGWCWGSFGAGF